MCKVFHVMHQSILLFLFCEITGKIKGEDIRPLWKYLYAATGTKPPTWNFKGKYLIDRTGKPHVVTDLEAQIKSLIDESAPECDASL